MERKTCSDCILVRVSHAKDRSDLELAIKEYEEAIKKREVQFTEAQQVVERQVFDAKVGFL